MYDMLIEDKRQRRSLQVKVAQRGQNRLMQKKELLQLNGKFIPYDVVWFMMVFVQFRVFL